MSVVPVRLQMAGRASRMTLMPASPLRAAWELMFAASSAVAASGSAVSTGW